jgi:crotonobetainyl-CoA:carnitine CoA-transferase CaiB-like acyl-CoA transferase
MTGAADGPPLLPSFPIGDMVAGLYAANAIMFALYHRHLHDGEGQMIDVSLFESLFSLLGPLPAEFAATGSVRLRQGSRSKNSGPRGAYQTSDGEWIAVSGSTPKMAETFLTSYGLADMLADERFATNEARVKHAVELDTAVQSAIGRLTLEENLAIIRQNKLTAIQVQTIADIERDPHWLARQLTVDVPDSDGAVRMHNVVPRLSETPGEIRWPGGPLDAHTDEFYQQQLGLSAEQIAALREQGVI